MAATANIAQLPAHVAQLLDAAAARYGITPALARAVAWTESRGNQAARGTSGELGVMQLMAATAQGLGADPAVLTENVDAGVRYLAAQVQRFGLRGGIAAYNAGPGRVLNAAGDESRWPASTRTYVERVLARAGLESGAPAFRADAIETAVIRDVAVNRETAAAVLMIAGAGLVWALVHHTNRRSYP